MSANRTSPHTLPFIVVQEFRVRPGRRRAFEKAYGPGGDWMRLFRRKQGHIRSELIRDRERPLCYLSLDFWTSRQAYERFMRQNHAEFRRIEKRCSFLTVEEKLIGKFDSLSPVRGTEPETVPLTIRPATNADVPGMITLERDVASAAHWPETTYLKIFDQTTPTRLAFTLRGQDSTVEGFVVASLHDQDCELENIVVSRRLQSKGWGKRLLATLVTAARSLHAKGIFLEVRESASPARGLYERCGFVRAGRRKGYYRSPVEDAILYRLDL